MSGLHVSRWQRQGHERLCVSTVEGAAVAWLDCRSGEVTVLVESRRAAALEALGPYLAARGPEAAAPRRTTSRGRTTSPTAPGAAGAPPRARTGTSGTGPGTDAAGAQRGADPGRSDEGGDLARNRPGEALEAKLDALGGDRTVLRLRRLLRLRGETDPWQEALRAQRAVATELRRRCPPRWHALHSVPLPGDDVIDHLLIGPGGVFCADTEYHPRAEVRVGEDDVEIGGRSHPYVRVTRDAARRAARALSRACGAAVEVTPLLVFVDAAEVRVEPALLDVRAVERRQLAALVAATGVLTPQRIDEVHAAARDRRTWTDA
ncbi:nuclease-related domain-containing protein [Streptomyces sp. Z26]|uniref:nuclease-related domain-containing protein n=1 Tax=Streptomyces sp. Z26 TaxID=2500177 RepID=UPI000EF17553|nr:nuclease-related domain-containing protein [Streptomyces sp. Z26]RLL67339.1 NERD domain-containing protein [Streptomyces sp. Z26]